MWGATLTAEYGRIIEVEGVSLFCRISNQPSINIFDCRNIFPVSSASFYILVDLSPAVTFIL
jgi:hypothetical protein